MPPTVAGSTGAAETEEIADLASNRRLLVYTVPGENIDAEQVAAVLAESVQHIEPTTAETGDCCSAATAAIVVFSDMCDRRVVEDACAACESLLLNHGLMAESGLATRHPPVDFVHPVVLLVRAMTVHDYPAAATNARRMSAYLTRFAPKIPARIRNIISDQVTDAVGKSHRPSSPFVTVNERKTDSR